MQIKELMTSDPACCTPETSLEAVAKMFVDNDCGAIPVVEDREKFQPIGIVTDRDIVVRTVAQGQNPLILTARDCMTSPVKTITLKDSVDDAFELMEKHQLRRMLVVDETGRCAGILAQADVVRTVSPKQAMEVVREVSQPSK